MTYEENVRAILECCFSESKDEIIDRAVKCIMAIKPEPVTIPTPNPTELPYRPFVTPYYTDPNSPPSPLGPTIYCKTSPAIVNCEDLKNSQSSNIIEGTKDKE